MRRSIILSTVLAASAAVLGACSTPAPNSPAKTPTPNPTVAPTVAATPAPSQSPGASPAGTPLKPAKVPDVKKSDESGLKPAVAETPKGK